MLIAIISDFFRHRFIFAVIPIAVAITGFIILLVEHHNTNVQYLACFLAVMGTYSALPITVCWFNTNRKWSDSLTHYRAYILTHISLVGGHDRRAVGTAWQVGFGNST